MSSNSVSAKGVFLLNSVLFILYNWTLRIPLSLSLVGMAKIMKTFNLCPVQETKTGFVSSAIIFLV